MKLVLFCSKKSEVGNRIWQYLATLTSTLSVISTGMVYGWSSPSLPLLLADDSPIPISTNEGFWLTVLSLVAAVTGGMFASKIVDMIGRKKSILIIAIPSFISWVLIGFAKNLVMLYTARLLAGIADVLTYSAVPIYIGEIADPAIRGLLGSVVQIMLTLGLVLVNVIGVNFSVSHTGFICAIIPALLFFTFMWMPESPYYHILKNEHAEAEMCLKRLRGVEDVSKEMSTLMETVGHQKDSSVGFISLMKQRNNRKAIGIMMGLRAVQQFSGIAAIMFYTKMIFQQADGSISADSSIYIYMGVQLTVSIISSFFIDIAGRKPLLTVSIIGSTLCLAVEGVYFYLKDQLLWDVAYLGWLPITALIGFSIIYSFGLGIVPVAMLSEMFSTEIKAFALCFMDVYFSLIVILILKFFEAMMDGYGIFVPFWTFSAICASGLIFIYLCVPETKGRTLEDIQCELRGELKTKNVSNNSELPNENV